MIVKTNAAKRLMLFPETISNTKPNVRSHRGFETKTLSVRAGQKCIQHFKPALFNCVFLNCCHYKARQRQGTERL